MLPKSPQEETQPGCLDQLGLLEQVPADRAA